MRRLISKRNIIGFLLGASALPLAVVLGVVTAVLFAIGMWPIIISPTSHERYLRTGLPRHPALSILYMASVVLIGMFLCLALSGKVMLSEALDELLEDI